MHFDMDQSLGFILNRTSLFSKTNFNLRLKKFGISPEQWSLLFRIVERAPLTQKELSDCTYKDQANITRTLDRLEQKEFLTRTQNENDRRSVLINPTQKAKDLVAKVVPLSREFNEALTEGFTNDERELLLTLLKRVAQNLENGVEDEIRK